MLRAVVVACVFALVVAGCSSSSTTSSQPTYPPIGSIVVMGDSVASGEGIAYDYKYEHRPILPMWSKGTPDPKWLGPIPTATSRARRMATWSPPPAIPS